MLLLQLLANGIFVGSVYALLGLSFATIFASTRIWHFAQGAVYTIGSYVLLVLAGWLDMPFGLAVLCGMVVCAGLGAAFMQLLYIPLERRGATPLVMVMASLGAIIIIDNLLMMYFGPTGYSIDVAVPDPVIVGGVFMTGGQMLTPLLSLCIVIAYLAILFRTKFGGNLRALIDNEELLLLNGIDTHRLKLTAFALGSALLPFAAALFVASGAGISISMGIFAVLTGAMAMFFGGIDRIEGAAAAGLLLGIIESLAAYFFPSEWQTAVTYALVLGFLLVRPTGLFGRNLPKTSL